MSSSSSESELGSQPGSGSESSTVIYRHECFADFRLKVLTLARSQIWPNSELKDVEIIVERLKGGACNRIIGLTLARSRDSRGKDGNSTGTPFDGRKGSEDVDTKYILRIPRFKSTQIDADVAALLFVHRLARAEAEQQALHKFEIPAPQVIMFDWTMDNALKSPFMVQNRLPGEPLVKVYPHLTYEQQRKVAQELGQVYRRMLAVSGVQAGRLVFQENSKSLDAEIHVTAWDGNAEIPRDFKKPRKQAITTPYRVGRDGESVLELLRRTFQDQKAEIQDMWPHDHFRPARLDQFCTMASEMDADGYFTKFDGYSTLAHLDLEPRNILVEKASHTHERIITGILDWDGATLAPAFMSCTPPMWIWAWKENEAEDERTANDIPPTLEKRLLKNTFESAAGPAYIEGAYQPVYRLARRLVRFAINGITSNEDDNEAESMLAEWQAIHQRESMEVVSTPSAPSLAVGESFKNRRSLQTLSDDVKIPQARIEEILGNAILNSSNPLNFHLSRAVMLVKKEHQKFWDLARDVANATVARATSEKADHPGIQRCRAAYGTILFYENPAPLKWMQENWSMLQDKLPQWADHANGMLQIAVWTSLTAEGLGCNLQHYNIMADSVAQEWNVPAEWKLKAQLVFGSPAGPAMGKDSHPAEPRMFVYGA